MAESLHAVLDGYSQAALQQIANLRRLEPPNKKKESLVQALLGEFATPASVEAALTDLSAAERALVQHLVVRGGQAPTARLRQALVDDGLIDRPATTTLGWDHRREVGSPSQRDSRRFEDVVARLGVLGLVFSARPMGGPTMVELGRPGWYLLVPDEILALVPTPDSAIHPVDPPSDLRSADGRGMLRDLYLLAAAAADERLPLTGRGQIAKRALVRVDGLLRQPEGAAAVRSEDDLRRLPLLRALAEALDLLRLENGALVAGQSLDTFFAQSAGERLRRLVQVWLTSPRWCELFHLAGVTVRTPGGIKSEAPAEVVAARQGVVAALARLTVGECFPVDAIVERFRIRLYDFLLPRGSGYAGYYYSYYDPYVVPSPYEAGNNSWGWTFRSPGDPYGFLKEDAGWNVVERGFIELVILLLHWLGVVDLATTERDGRAVPAVLRLTSDGARLLRGEAPGWPAEATNVVVQPNFQIFAFEPIDESIIQLLDRFADRVRAEQAIEYRLTRESVYRAQRAGTDAATVIATLERVSSVPLPQNVRRSLEEWGAQHERIVVRRRAPVLETVDAATLDALYADPTIGALLGRRAGPTIALVPPANLTPLDDRLIARDRLPATTVGDEVARAVATGAPRPLYQVDASGQVTFRQRLPSVYARRALAAFADDADGQPRITPASLRRAARAGLDADRVIATLERLHAGPVPDDVLTLVRESTRDWGEGALIGVTLLQVQSADVLTDIFADARLRSGLQRVPGADTVAIVRPEAVERVRALLAARGMELRDQLLR